MPKLGLLHLAPCALVIVVSACGDDDADIPPTAALDASCLEAELPPTNGTVREWLDTQVNYGTWAQESGPHPSSGPHFGDVLTYVNTCLEQSMAARNESHPVGAASVKEFFGSEGGTEVQGWAVSVKVDDSGGGDDWYWYERFQGEIFADARGDSLCVNCHNDGIDHVLTTYPLQ